MNFVLARDIGNSMFIFVAGDAPGAADFVGTLSGASRFRSVEEAHAYRKWMGLSPGHFLAYQIATDGRILNAEKP